MQESTPAVPAWLAGDFKTFRCFFRLEERCAQGALSGGGGKPPRKQIGTSKTILLNGMHTVNFFTPRYSNKEG